MRPAFANQFAYRGLFPRDSFLEITKGAINAGKGTLFCGENSYVVVYPVEKGSLINIVAVKIVPTPGDDPEFLPLQHDANWIQPVSSETMLKDFAHWGSPMKALLSNIQRPQRWAMYDQLPAPTYVKGRVVLLGDAAHATTPHQGQGAGMAFEDSFILSNILGQILNQPFGDGSENEESGDVNLTLECCLRAYDQVRRTRTQKVTSTSREMGELLCFAKEGIGRDLVKLKENLDKRLHWIWDVDLLGELNRGIEIARRELKDLRRS
jgi:salicylate hydroxylase